MCDQLSSVGVEFSKKRMTDIFKEALGYGAVHPFPYVPKTFPAWFRSWFSSVPPKPWAHPDLCEYSSHVKRDKAECTCKSTHPEADLNYTFRPWGLGQVRAAPAGIQTWAGTAVRKPGHFMRQDPQKNTATVYPLEYTNERIHSSVRVRLASQGLGNDDRGTWECDSMKDEAGRPLWRLERGAAIDGSELIIGENEDDIYAVKSGDNDWKWVFSGETKGEGKQMLPQMNVLPEEPLNGYWERYLLQMSVGKNDVWRWAQEHPPRFMENV